MSNDGAMFGGIAGLLVSFVTYDKMGTGCLIWPVVGGMLGEGISGALCRKDNDSSYKRAREQELKQQARVYSRWDTLQKRLDRVVSAYCQMSPKSETKTAQYHRIISRIEQELDSPINFAPKTLAPKYSMIKRIGLLQGALN